MSYKQCFAKWTDRTETSDKSVVRKPNKAISVARTKINAKACKLLHQQQEEKEKCDSIIKCN